MDIVNPVLPGFHPDPSILRVGGDYFLATSTFQWFPGVRIHHSRDLVHWRPLTHALAETRLLDLSGTPDSGGVWAPCLSHDGRNFHLVYTVVHGHRGAFRDIRNYLVTAPDILGPWSDPVFLNASGFDPSLFHDADGRKWLVNQVWDHRPDRNPFAGILLQEYDPIRRTLKGSIRNIFSGTARGLVEGPHLYRIQGWYYLLTAEGGTFYEHAATVARSRTLEGPYEADPGPPLLTSWERPDLALQKAGHGSLVQTPDGEWYLAHLCGRPDKPRGRCMLGRETALQKCRLTEDGWIRLEGGGNHPRRVVPAPVRARPQVWEEPVEADSLGDLHRATLRHPPDPTWFDAAARPGWLKLRGRGSLCSQGPVSLVARRLQAFRVEAGTVVLFAPDSFQQRAGLVFYYDSANWIYLRISREEGMGLVVGVEACDHGRLEVLGTAPLAGIGEGPIHLKGRLEGGLLAFSFSQDGFAWTGLGPKYEASRLSDDYVGGEAFTGTFIGLCAQDLAAHDRWAYFRGLRYEEAPAGDQPSAGAATGSEIPSRNSGLR